MITDDYEDINKFGLPDSLKKEEYAELTELADAPIEGNTVSLSEFKNIMNQWRRGNEL